MVDVASFPPTSATVAAAKSMAPGTPAVEPNPPPVHNHVQVWMAEMKTSPKTVEAVLNLNVGGAEGAP